MSPESGSLPWKVCSPLPLLLCSCSFTSSSPWPRPPFWSQLCSSANDAETASCQHIPRAAGARLHKLVNKAGPLPRQRSSLRGENGDEEDEGGGPEVNIPALSLIFQ